MRNVLCWLDELVAAWSRRVYLGLLLWWLATVEFIARIFLVRCSDVVLSVTHCSLSTSAHLAYRSRRTIFIAEFSEMLLSWHTHPAWISNGNNRIMDGNIPARLLRFPVWNSFIWARIYLSRKPQYSQVRLTNVSNVNIPTGKAAPNLWMDLHLSFPIVLKCSSVALNRMHKNTRVCELAPLFPKNIPA